MTELSTTSVSAPERDFADFRAEREAYTTGPRSPVHFAWGNHVESPRVRVLGSPGRWSPLADGRAGLAVDATVDDGIRIGGAVVDGRGELFWKAEDGPTVAELPHGAEAVIFSYDGKRFAVQVWNDHSPWVERFGGISAYPYDPAWRITAEVRPVHAGRTVAISHYRHPEPVPVAVIAELAFEVGGDPVRMLATRGQDGMSVQFRDATNGGETYGAGRAVRVDPGSDPEHAIMDFNFSTLLPCAFSEAWNCPLPARENTLLFAVRAGERHAVDHSGAPML